MHTKVVMRDRHFSYFTFITLLWLTGLMVGLAVSFHFSSITAPMIQAVYIPDLSLCGIFMSGVVPLALAYCFIKLQWMHALYIYLFINAFLYGFSYFSLALCFQNAAWFATGVSFLSHSCCNLLMVFMCLNCTVDHFFFRKVAFNSFCSFAVICVLEHLIAAYIN